MREIDKKIKLNYLAFANNSGYSYAAMNNIKALYQSNKYDIRLNIFGDRPNKNVVSDEEYEFLMSLTKKKDFDDNIIIYHCIPTMQKRVKKEGRRNIGVAVFETYSPPENWFSILNENDAIIVPSKFNYNIFSHGPIKKPIYYVPHSINTTLYNKDIKPLNKYNKFTFLFMGTWKERKGYPQLIEAWFSEFREKDNVQLIIKTDKPKQAESYVKRIKKEMGIINKGNAPILFESKVYDEKMLPRFMKNVDCYVSNTLGEGFGICGLQSMALKIPVIITNYSGCQDYAKENNCTLIPVSGFILHKNMDGIPQFRNKKWAFVEVKRIRESMRYVLNNNDIIKRKAENAYNYVMENFNYKVVENNFSEMIKEIYE